MIDGHYASNNFWALLGLRQAVRLARFLGRGKEQEDWARLERRYRENILKGVEVSVNADGYLPPGLYPYLTGKQARRGFSEYQTNCDWENMLLAFPTELLEPLNPIVRATVERIRRGYAEGVMTYRHGQHLHQYITVNQIQQYLVMGDSYAALKDFYHTLLHAGSTHECFENLVIPWTDRQVNAHCPPPHAWASSILGLLIPQSAPHGIRRGRRTRCGQARALAVPLPLTRMGKAGPEDRLLERANGIRRAVRGDDLQRGWGVRHLPSGIPHSARGISDPHPLLHDDDGVQYRRAIWAERGRLPGA